jgi:hypothetical protein
MSQFNTLNFGYKKQGNILIPTINSLDTILTIDSGPKPVVVRKVKGTFVFKTDDAPDQIPVDGDLRGQLIDQFGGGIFAEDPCQLPYEAKIDLELKVGAGVDFLFAGATVGLKVNIGGGISYDDDRNFRGYYYYHFSVYVQAYFLASSVSADFLFYGQQVDKYFDGINHYSDYMMAFASALHYDVQNFFSTAKGLRPEIPEHVVAIKTPSIINDKFEGITLFERTFDVSFTNSSTKDIFVRTRDGMMMSGSTENRTFSIKGLFPTFSIGSVAELNIIVNLIFDKVDNNYNTNNDGEYLGIALDFIITPKSDDSTVAVKENLYNQVQKAAESFKGIMDTLFEFFASYKSALPNYYSIREVLINNQKGLANELKKITLDNNLEPKKLSSSFSFTGSLGMQYLRYYVKEEDSYNLQYSRISVWGNIEIGYGEELKYGPFIGELDVKLDLSMKVAIAEAASNKTTTYFHTVYDGFNSNIKGNQMEYNIYPVKINNRRTNDFLPYWRNHKGEFVTEPDSEENTLNYLEKSRMNKLILDEKKWIKEKGRTLSISMSLATKEKRIRFKIVSNSALKFSTLKEALRYSDVGGVNFTGVNYNLDGVNSIALNKGGNSNDLSFATFLKDELHPSDEYLTKVLDPELSRFVTAWNFKTIDLQSNIADILAFFNGVDKYFDFSTKAQKKVDDFKVYLKKNALRDIKKAANNLSEKVFKDLTQARDDAYQNMTPKINSTRTEINTNGQVPVKDSFDFKPTRFHQEFVATGIVAEDYLDSFVNFVLLNAKIN